MAMHCWPGKMRWLSIHLSMWFASIVLLADPRVPAFAQAVGAAPEEVPTLRTAQAALVTVPNVIGQPAAKAWSLLSKQGLNSRVTGQASTSNQAQQDRVASQSPLPGQRVNRGTVVSVTLYHFAGAPGQVTVPSVVGQPASNAQGILSGQGLVPRVAGQVSTPNQAQQDRVASQSPLPGQRVNRGTVVNLTVFRF
ncbi:MAG: PASTA domain-containing protein, partial [Candidatus Tectomicrobia bacterium]|nr:PASTA domain-containing protein [Candidatus Tectomicrobia bacterium]